MKWFVTERRHGNARAPGSLAKLLKKRGWPARAAVGKQVHGDRIAVISESRDIRFWQGQDGFVTDQSNVPLGIFTADCLSIFLASEDRQVVGALHAGWRGVQNRITVKALRLIRQKWGIPAKRVHVWAGPAIGSCCFEVGWEVARFFPATRRRKGQKWHVDLRQEIKNQVRQMGAKWQRQHDIPVCTRHEKRYHSFRRDGTDERQVSVILKND